MDILLLLASLLALSNAHNIALKAHTRECFFEELHKDDKMTVTFQVGDRDGQGNSGNLEIDFTVCSTAAKMGKGALVPWKETREMNRDMEGQ